MPDETLDVAPSEDNGNVPLDTPSEPTPTPEAQPEAEPVATTEPTQALYDLPDGRKVDAETLQKEWKENFLPEFTRRSQELSALKGKQTAPQEQQINNTPDDPYADPNYIPKSYAEIIEAAEARALAKIEAKEREALETRQAVETQVANDIAELKKTDPNLNVDSLFNHAVKYNFSDLKVAYQNMKDMQGLVKTVQKETVKNIAKRNDPVATKPGAIGNQVNPRNFNSAVDYLRTLSGQQ